MTVLAFRNRAVSTLANAIDSLTTTIEVASGHGSRFPTIGSSQAFVVTVQHNEVFEIMRCTARTGDVLTVVRGQEGTAPAAFPAGAAVQMLITAGVHDAFVQGPKSLSSGVLLGRYSAGTGVAEPVTLSGLTISGSGALSLSDGSVTPAKLSSVFYLPIDGSQPMAGALRAVSGTVAAPGVAFAGDTDTGLFQLGADTAAIATGGGLRLSVANAAVTLGVPLRIAPGSAAAPGLAVDGDADTGLYRPAADALAVATGGAVRLTVGDTAVTAAVPVVLPADPTATMQAATKQYVDVAIIGAPGKLLRVWETATSTTWTPVSGSNLYLMLVVGGGESGGWHNGGYGGKAGVRVWRWHVGALGPQTVTVGAGGAPVAAAYPHNPGGTSSIGSIVQAPGGGGSATCQLLAGPEWTIGARPMLINPPQHVGEHNNTTAYRANGWGWGAGGNGQESSGLMSGAGAPGRVVIWEWSV